MSRPKFPPSVPCPHSWGVDNWPETVFPNDPGRARYLIRANKTSLLEAGAIVRVGRALVVQGQPFAKWLASQAGRVSGYEIPPNRPTQEAA